MHCKKHNFRFEDYEWCEYCLLEEYAFKNLDDAKLNIKSAIEYIQELHKKGEFEEFSENYLDFLKKVYKAL